jgi:shikimate kinase
MNLILKRSILPQSNTVVKTHSAISVVNAIGTGFGAAIGISIPCQVEASLIPANGEKEPVVIRTSTLDKHRLIPKCVEYVEQFLSVRVPKDYQLQINVDSKIPVAVGLKSSSSISTAVVAAVAMLFGKKELDSKAVLRLSCDASKDSGASITGAYDDATSCFLGGLVLTDNSNYRILKHSKIPENLGRIVLVRAPTKSKVYTSSVNKYAYAKYKNNSRVSFELTMKGDIKAAMILNSLVQCSVLGYSFDPILVALEEGATCAGISGKGPALSAMCTTNKIANRIETRWREMKDGHEFTLIRTTTFDARDV